MAKETLTEKREKLTALCVKAREEYHAAERKAKYEVRKANPGLKDKDWVAFYDLVEKDPEVRIANAKLLALCEAANIMGAEIG